jgi:hypothetical protein
MAVLQKKPLTNVRAGKERISLGYDVFIIVITVIIAGWIANQLFMLVPGLGWQMWEPLFEFRASLRFGRILFATKIAAALQVTMAVVFARQSAFKFRLTDHADSPDSGCSSKVLIQLSLRLNQYGNA